MNTTPTITWTPAARKSLTRLGSSWGYFSKLYAIALVANGLLVLANGYALMSARRWDTEAAFATVVSLLASTLLCYVMLRLHDTTSRAALAARAARLHAEDGDEDFAFQAELALQALRAYYRTLTWALFTVPAVSLLGTLLLTFALVVLD